MNLFYIHCYEQPCWIPFLASGVPLGRLTRRCIEVCHLCLVGPGTRLVGASGNYRAYAGADVQLGSRQAAFLHRS